MDNIGKAKYYLFIDECGDHNLTKFDPGFPVFTLCGILVSRQNLNALNKAFENLKLKYSAPRTLLFIPLIFVNGAGLFLFLPTRL